MKSKIEDLQCPCGCELGVPHRLEWLYWAFKEQGFTVTGLVNCEGKNTTVRVTRTDIRASQAQGIRNILRHNRIQATAQWQDHEACWVVDVSGKAGVLY